MTIELPRGCLVKTFWSKVKQGAIPLILLGVFYKLVQIISATGFRVTGWPIVDALLNVLLAIGIAFSIGHVLGYQCVKNWIEKHYAKFLNADRRAMMNRAMPSLGYEPDNVDLLRKTA